MKEVAKGVYLSRNGRWQYRATESDIREHHVHVEEVKGNVVIRNWHYRWP